MKLNRLLGALLFLVTCAANPAWSQISQFCFGDGSAASGPCPCGNISAPMTGGCLNSLGTPGVLTAFAMGALPSVSADISGNNRLTLAGSGMPNAACRYFQGTATLPALFGDGIRCVNNPLQVQLGTRINVAGASFVGGSPGPAIALQGALATPLIAPITMSYQCWYRNNAAFCTPALFNMTNAVSIVWAP
ncbi:MAG: hypothetical protein NTY35_02885 [Planctomycetota bacterium]|nr:hypothetical protein [Planctomycetota bacterium]